MVCRSQTLIDEPVRYRGDKTVEFHLIYAGDLLKAAGSGRGAKRVWEKHAIRKYLHPQLKRLWETHPALREYGSKSVIRDENDNEFDPPKPFLEVLAHNYERSGIGFIPLMTEPNGLACSLEILFLRPDKPGNLPRRHQVLPCHGVCHFTPSLFCRDTHQWCFCCG